jgi:hypothetical protein
VSGGLRGFGGCGGLILDGRMGAGRDRLRIVRTYQGALDFFEAFGDPEVARDLILALAEAKGLLGLKEAQADIFFNG